MEQADKAAGQDQRRDSAPIAELAGDGRKLIAAEVLTDTERQIRAMPFDKAPIEEQVRRLHREVVMLRETVIAQNTFVNELRGHQHGPAGDLVVPLHRLRQGYAAGEAVRRDPLA